MWEGKETKYILRGAGDILSVAHILMLLLATTSCSHAVIKQIVVDHNQTDIDRFRPFAVCWLGQTGGRCSRCREGGRLCMCGGGVCVSTCSCSSRCLSDVTVHDDTTTIDLHWSNTTPCRSLATWQPASGCCSLPVCLPACQMIRSTIGQLHINSLFIWRLAVAAAAPADAASHLLR